ncbi:hypothetical protein HUJ04_008626 [Dendroctonus ponderosae]|nr:hypothetical protein HUJ04_008626 [Dendroctonus ponderosae]
MWDFALSKAPTNLPKLPTQPPTQLDKLLKPVRSLAVPSDSESDCSGEVVDAFEEFHRESFLRPLPGTKRKFLPKLEADWKTVGRFSEDFKQTMASIRRCLKARMASKVYPLPGLFQLEDGLMSEEGAAVELQLSNGERQCFFTDFQSFKEDSVPFEEEHQESETTSSEQGLKFCIGATAGGRVADSAVWNMIQAHQAPHFSTSPPQYDIYSIKPAHYLKRPHVPWREVEESRRKCEQWLGGCHAE